MSQLYIKVSPHKKHKVTLTLTTFLYCVFKRSKTEQTRNKHQNHHKSRSAAAGDNSSRLLLVMVTLSQPANLFVAVNRAQRNSLRQPNLRRTKKIKSFLAYSFSWIGEASADNNTTTTLRRKLNGCLFPLQFLDYFLY